jgi:protoheme IX farnesyltransferase
MYANKSTQPQNALSQKVDRIRYLLLAAAITTFLLMIAGTIVRASGAGQACPDWPTCYGQFGIPDTVQAQIQVAHRGLALLAALLTWAAAFWAVRGYARIRWITIPLLVGSVIMLFESLIGSLSILKDAGFLVTTLHMALAMLAFGSTLLATVTAFILHDRPDHSGRLAFPAPFARLTLWTMGGIFILMVNGTLIAHLNASVQCAGWPLCSGGLPVSGLGWLALGHRAITLVVGGLVAAQFFRAWRSQRSQIVELPAATGVFILTAGQVVIGALKVQRGYPADLIGLHAASAAALWGVQVVAVVAAGLAGRSVADEAAEAFDPLPLKRRFLDFIILSKPVIVLLLLVTTYAGMVVGGRHIPDLNVTFWTMVGGALAAGGASALNQYLDRETDKAMQRTQKRPIPDGRLKPPEGLAYGLGACLAAFFLLAGYVNLLAAVLSLLGMIYYVLLYSVWLKHLTVQNIVIGGGAGAIPPLVGWAAVTGRLDIPAFFLFAIIFFWTPPHFWALALVRRNDYARGNVPMLPVVKGEAETRKQVFVYTLELVGLTLLMPILKMAGSVYLVSALVLGAWLIYTAWRVLKQGGNKTAWTMYRTSSMYLMFLFVALVIDVLI